ncbi:MAG TPA: glutaredoxin family protein [Candidatus Deferrimicrobiaceae bacterium]|jgi:glutaredoxin
MKKVSMYTLSTCPWCRKTKIFFTQHNVPFDFTDYDLADEATQDRIMRELDAVGANGFPFVRIGDQIVEGYRPDRYADLLGL